MRTLLFTLMCIIAAAAAAAATSSSAVYKWVDENGVTHYSDQPHPGAQKIQLQAVQTYKAPSQRGATVVPRNRPSGAQPYTTCVVSRPTSQEMFQNTQSVPASVHVEPDLRAGDRVSVLLDGAAVQSDIPVDSEFALNSVYRGAHSLAVKVEDSTGAVVCQSPSVAFNVRQSSVLAPNSPLAPPPPVAPSMPVAPSTPLMRPH
jgi:Domain of unknown function (DUF4124)